MTEYRIVYSIQRSLDYDADEFEEIGFGAETWRDILGALHMVATAVESRGWETEPGQPDPEDIDLRAGDHDE